MSTEAKRGRYYGAWCAYLKAIMEERLMKPAQFADFLKERRNSMTQYTSGQVRPPLGKLEPWSKRLSLTEPERLRFIRLAHLEWAPKPVRDELESLRRRAERVEGLLRALLVRHGEDPGEHGL